MSRLVVPTTAEDGFLNNISGVYNAEGFIVVSTSSSSDAIENQGFWFFNTADGVTGLPASAVIHRVRFGIYPISSYEPSMGSPWWTFYACNDGCNGATLTMDDWGRPTTHPSGLFAGWSFGKYLYIDMDSSIVNRSGYTNIRCECFANDTPGGSVTFDVASAEGGLGNPGILVIDYNIPEGTVLL